MEYRGLSSSVVRDGVSGGRVRSLRMAALKAGVNGVEGVLGVDMYRPLHFGQRMVSSVDDDEIGRMPLSLPALRGWYR